MMMKDEANVGNAEIGNRLSTEEFNTIARNWPVLKFAEEKPEPTLDPLATFFAIQSLALKKLQKNEPQVAAYSLRKRVQSPSRLVRAAQNALRSNIFI